MSLSLPYTEQITVLGPFLSYKARIWLRKLINQKPLPEIFYKKLLLKISQSSQENTCVGVSFSWSCTPEGPQIFLIETLTQVFSCEYREIFKSSYFEIYLWMTVSDTLNFSSSYQTTNLLKTWFLFLVCKKRQKEDNSEFVTTSVGIIVTIIFM